MRKPSSNFLKSRQERTPNLFDLERLCDQCDQETTLEQSTLEDGWKRICHTCLSKRGGTYKEDQA